MGLHMTSTDTTDKPKASQRVSMLLWALLLLAIIGVIAGAFFRPRHREMTELFATPNLTLTDQDGRAFTMADLRGHPWVADFVFTNCAGSCPIMSHKMAQLLKSTPTEVQFVSFTVDPEHDTSAALRQYGEALKADFNRWHFLTGTARQMADAACGMKISVKPADKDEPILHSNKFLLVDGRGGVVGIYDGTSDQELGRLEADARSLVR